MSFKETRYSFHESSRQVWVLQTAGALGTPGVINYFTKPRLTCPSRGIAEHEQPTRDVPVLRFGPSTDVVLAADVVVGHQL